VPQSSLLQSNSKQGNSRFTFASQHIANYSAIVLSDNYRLSLPAVTPPREWTIGCVGYVNTIRQPTGSDKRNLLDKIMTLYNRQTFMHTFLAERLNTFHIKHPLTVELSVLTITRRESIYCVSSHNKGERRKIFKTFYRIRPVLLIIHQRQLSLIANTDCRRF